MASYNELNALIDAYINRNGVQAITGQILNGVLKAMVEQLGRGYTIMGAAIPTTDPGTPDGPECYFASAPGTYTDFDGLQVVPGELALLCYTPSDGWTKETIYEGFQEVQATIDGNVGTPSVGVSYADGVLSFDFHNMKGNPGEPGEDGDPAGFGTIGADITGGVGTPGVSVESSGPATAKNLQFHFTNLKGETGVTSVVVTVDNTTGTPTCTASLSVGVLTLAFTGLKGVQGNPGSSVDYPFTLVNNLTTDDPDQALTAAMGVQLESEISQLEAEVDNIVKDTINDGADDFYIADGNDEAVAKFSDGEIETQKFKSKETPKICQSAEAEFDIADENGEIIARFKDGGIKTKNFDSTSVAKKPYTSAWERFVVKINRAPVGKFDNDHNAATDDPEPSVVEKNVTGVIALPPTYTPMGKPTKLLCFCHGTRGNVTQAEWYNNNPLMIDHFVPFWLARGYAVFDCNGVADGEDRYYSGNSAPCGLPDTMQAYIKCFDYIRENYNVEQQVYLWGCSDGGPVPLNWLFCRPGSVKAIAECDAVIDLLADSWNGDFSHIEDRRQNIADRLGFTGGDYSSSGYENDKADIWNPYARIKDIGGTKYAWGFYAPIFMASTASGSYFASSTFHIRETFAEAIRNGGSICLSKWYATFSHDDVAMGGDDIVLNDVLKWFNRF